MNIQISSRILKMIKMDSKEIQILLVSDLHWTTGTVIESILRCYRLNINEKEINVC
jgi:hypothetical protein